jgi:Domain of unknown function (DUF1707)/Cell wall-active antibiotics response 4TMS YvqF
VTRASDAEREAVVARLQAAASEGRLTVEELAERIDLAYAARTHAELEPLTADLPAAPAAAGGMAVAGPAGGGAVASGGRSATILGILGGGDRTGRWRVPARTTVVNIMGGADLDLREAVLETPEVEITVWSLMGGSDITVPEGVHVELEGFALLGANKLDLDPTDPAPAPGAPVVRVKAWSLMGGTDVKARRSRRRRGLPDPPSPPPLP